MPQAQVIVDTSIWIDHLNKGDADLVAVIRRRRILVHSMVTAEVALGSLSDRRQVLTEFLLLPQVSPASHAEVIALIEDEKLFGSGIGYVDAHLLAAARQVTGGRLWTRDKRLHAQAERLGVAWTFDWKGETA